MSATVPQLLDRLDRGRAELRLAVDAVPLDLRGQRPAPERWSVAEVIEHLARVEGSITQFLAGAIAGLRDGAPAAPPAAAGTLDEARLRDRSRRVTAADAFHPGEGLDAAAAWARLEETRARLRDALRGGDGLPLETLVLPHPVFGPLDLDGWVTFVAGHEARHAEQVREAGAQLAAR